nr:tyrosine-type recombinase/integrase [Micromonospora vinacea]
MSSGGRVGRRHPVPAAAAVPLWRPMVPLGWLRSRVSRRWSAAGLDPRDWTPRELRHSFVSLLSDSGMSLEQIADLCGHSGTTVTESVYRHQLRPVLLGGAVAMDRIFDAEA